METPYDIRDILGRIPHRYPFLLVDRILECEPGKRIVGIKNVTMNEPYFQGHFPGAPVMPGVLIVEAMAQTAAILVLGHRDDRDRKLVFFSGINNARFRRPVVPGDVLRIEMDVVRLRESFCKVQGVASVDGGTAVEAEVMASLVDRPQE